MDRETTSDFFCTFAPAFGSLKDAIKMGKLVRIRYCPAAVCCKKIRPKATGHLVPSNKKRNIVRDREGFGRL